MAVRDVQGGMTPSVPLLAVLTAMLLAAGLSAQSTTTGDDGLYVFARVIPGRYSIVAEKSGFPQAQRSRRFE